MQAGMHEGMESQRDERMDETENVGAVSYGYDLTIYFSRFPDTPHLLMLISSAALTRKPHHWLRPIQTTNFIAPNDNGKWLTYPEK